MGVDLPFWSYMVQHFVLSGISLIGIIGAIHQSNATTNGDFTSAKYLRLVSGILFGIVVLIIVVMLILTVMYRHRLVYHGSTAQIGLTFWWLSFLTTCVGIETIYRIWSTTQYTGFIVKEAAIDVFIFLPELLGILAWLSVDANNLLQLEWLFARKNALNENQVNDMEKC